MAGGLRACCCWQHQERDCMNSTTLGDILKTKTRAMVAIEQTATLRLACWVMIEHEICGLEG